MKFLGLEIIRTKAVESVTPSTQLNAVDNRGWYRIFESIAGAFQRNIEITVDNVTTHPAVFACVTLIASDISKMRMRLVKQDDDGIWNEVDVPAFSPVLRKPNHYQNRIQFFEVWLYSKLLWGNTYVLKVRDQRQVVTDFYVLDPSRVKPLVSPNGDVFYQVGRDDLSQLPQSQGYVIPASEIIHDRFNCLFHPLVGLSPIYAAGLAALQGLNIQNNSTNFFGQGSLPGGVLTAPGHIPQATAERLKDYFDSAFSGANAGKVAVLGDDLKYQQMTMSARDAQLIDQLKWGDEIVCSVFHVPAYMVGLGPPPNYNNIEALSQQYYSQCLQILVEAIELCLDEGFGLTTGAVAAQRYGTEFDLDDLLRMDSATMMETLDRGKTYITPNEGRKRLNYKPVPGGDTVYRQEQDHSLEALNKRDTQPDPFAKTAPPQETAPAPKEATRAVEIVVSQAPTAAKEADAEPSLSEAELQKAAEMILRNELTAA
jgi:HK97 family phage portal protein